ncbi:MAG TPA: ISL3 family transposase [Thermoanaerobaculia bacterium]|nr:ISL3 family transposase [Thermoanaerobaculia bacterium]
MGGDRLWIHRALREPGDRLAARCCEHLGGSAADGLSWDQVDGIIQRGVKRGLVRRDSAPLPTATNLGVDETSFQRRHEYVTTVADCTATGRVLHVADGRGREALADFLEERPEAWLESVQTIAMDMWGPYISAARAHLPRPHETIAFDRFHVLKLLSDAVDQVRRQESRELRAQGDERLKGTRFLWLRHPDRLNEEQLSRFAHLRDSSLKTARAWAIRELAIRLWERAPREDLEEAWGMWYSWAIRSRLAPIKRSARTIRHYLWGILNAITTGVANARLEGLNATIQWIKTSAKGFRNRERFRNAIYFHLGGLDLYPRSATHTTS